MNTKNKAIVAVTAAAVASVVAGFTPHDMFSLAGSPHGAAARGILPGMDPGAGMEHGGPGMNPGSYAQPKSYSFRTVGDQADPTFNQLLGVNNAGQVAGYFGSGAQGHPNKGYRAVDGGDGGFIDENFPNSVQTQVTGINDEGVTVGFFSTMNNADQMNDNTGFYRVGGLYHRVAYPTQNPASPPVDQLLGVNDSGVAVGFYTDAAGNNHAYEYKISHGSYRAVSVAGATSATAAAINSRGDIAGFYTGSGGMTQGFLLTADGAMKSLAYPGASMTQALGVSDHGEVVGVYQIGTGNSAQTHGFTWTAAGSFASVDDPNGVGTTTVNGVNNAGDLVGFYVDGAGNTDGMLAKPSSSGSMGGGMSSGMGGTGASAGASASASASSQPSNGVMTQQLMLNAMPTGTVAVSQNSDGTVQAHVTASGFTPGSSHMLEIDAAGLFGPVVRLGVVTADSAGRIDMTGTSVEPLKEPLPYGSRVVIRLGLVNGDSTVSPFDRLPIAQSSVLPARPYGGSSDLSAVSTDINGDNLGRLGGQAQITYDPAKQTLTVTVNATGLTPGNHAAHIHSGSCQNQGPVLQMLPDFTADANGTIANQTRTVNGVTSMPAAGTWYLNLHMGDSNSILVNGGPALSFRPLLCANG